MSETNIIKEATPDQSGRYDFPIGSTFDGALINAPGKTFKVVRGYTECDGCSLVHPVRTEMAPKGSPCNLFKCWGRKDKLAAWAQEVK